MAAHTRWSGSSSTLRASQVLGVAAGGWAVGQAPQDLPHRHTYSHTDTAETHVCAPPPDTHTHMTLIQHAERKRSAAGGLCSKSRDR